MGGAIVPLITGRIADSFGLRTGMCLLYLTLAWVFAVSLWAKPLITNRKFGQEKPSNRAT
jgi:fucose permease